MNITAATNLACPLDALPLAAEGAALRCANGHNFDRAREGYWNLLLVQNKASRDPGDGKEMVAARRRFLDPGHFAPIADGVFAALSSLACEADDNGPLNVVDAGCGEGYYLNRLAQLAAASTGPGELNLAGYDVSKWAVQVAARRKCPVTWMVANSSKPPFLAASVDLFLCLFGFPVWDGFKRVQKSGARVLLVDPGPDHLIEVRETIYPTVIRSGPPSLAQAEAAGYQLESEVPVRFSIELESSAEIQDLVAMTPHAYRMPQAGREALARLERLDVTAEVVLRIVRLT